jgi:hypothetical protein
MISTNGTNSRLLGRMPFVRLTDREEQLIRYQNMGSLQIPICVPAWLLQDLTGMLQSPAGKTLNIVMYRYIVH